MAKSTPKHLKVYTEQPPEVHAPGIEGVHSLADVCQAVQRATGWSLRYVAGPAPRCGRSSPWSTPVNRGCGIAIGHLELDANLATPAGQKAAIAEDSVRQLASAVAGMLGELLQTQHVLWQREAELAAGVPLVPASDEANHLAVRLEAVLKGGAEAVGCQAAALYLLDEDTSHLKLRSCWGLSRDRLLDPARPLRGAIADLEALLGNAVVLEDTQRMQPWKSPEEGYAAAACVPIATSTTLLGTFWVFSTTGRDFDDQQTNLLEIVAGRLAADLEREMLLREGIDGAKLKRQLAAAERLQQDQLPAIAPQVEGWDLAGWATQAQTLGGGFFDWFCLDDGRLAIALGSAAGRGMESALTAVRSANRHSLPRAAARWPNRYWPKSTARSGPVPRAASTWDCFSGCWTRRAAMRYGVRPGRSASSRWTAAAGDRSAKPRPWRATPPTPSTGPAACSSGRTKRLWYAAKGSLPPPMRAAACLARRGWPRGRWLCGAARRQSSARGFAGCWRRISRGRREPIVWCWWRIGGPPPMWTGTHRMDP